MGYYTIKTEERCKNFALYLNICIGGAGGDPPSGYTQVGYKKKKV